MMKRVHGRSTTSASASASEVEVKKNVKDGKGEEKSTRKKGNVKREG